MGYEAVLALCRQGLWVAALVLMPPVAAALLVGLAVSVVQAMTQVNEPSLSTVLKLIVVALVLSACGSWISGTILGFSAAVFELAHSLGSAP
jgi:flagellar biosynthetic protein FliQ